MKSNKKKRVPAAWTASAPSLSLCAACGCDTDSFDLGGVFPVTPEKNRSRVFLIDPISCFIGMRAATGRPFFLCVLSSAVRAYFVRAKDMVCASARLVPANGYEHEKNFPK